MMNTRLALLELAAQYQLDAAAQARLWRLAGFDAEPDRLVLWLRRGLALLAAALGGLGIIFWIAANWDAMGRTGHFVLLQGFVVAMCAGAALVPGARQAFSLLALLAIGGLFAYFGQTYQTGADSWQLFALWALLALPVCIGARSDSVWSAWAMVAALAIARWDYAHAGYSWGSDAANLPVHAGAWAAMLALTLALSRPASGVTGAGTWAFRTALTLSTVFVTITALTGVFDTRVAPHYWLGLLLCTLAAWSLARSRLYDLYGLSIVSLGANILAVGGLGRALLIGVHGEAIGQLLILGLLAAGFLAATVRAILNVSRQRASTGVNA
jgi:uncharacterized membrane protein